MSRRRRSAKKRAAALAALPDPCDLCRPFDGVWKESETGGMERCTCARGEALGRIANPWKYRHERPATAAPSNYYEKEND